MQCFGNPLLPVPAILGFDCALQRVQLAHTIAVLIDQRDHARNAGTGGNKNCGVLIQHRFLSYIGQAQVLL